MRGGGGEEQGRGHHHLCVGWGSELVQLTSPDLPLVYSLAVLQPPPTWLAMCRSPLPSGWQCATAPSRLAGCSISPAMHACGRWLQPGAPGDVLQPPPPCWLATCCDVLWGLWGRAVRGSQGQ